MKEKKQVKSETGLARAEVINTVNLNLNQNDIMDIAIQEELAKLEEAIEVNETQLTKRKEEYTQILNSAITDYARKQQKDDENYKKFLKICTLLGVKTPKLSWQTDHYGKKTIIEIGKYKEIDFDNLLAQYKNAIPLARHGRENTEQVSIPSRIELTFTAVEDPNVLVDVNDEDSNRGEELSSQLKVTYSNSKFELSKELHADLVKRLKPLAKEILGYKITKYELGLRRYQFSTGEKRIKAKIMKTALSKSEQGRQVLAMMEEATKVKLLG